MKNILKYIASFGWEIVEAIFEVCLTPLKTLLTPNLTNKLKDYWNKLDEHVRNKINKI